MRHKKKSDVDMIQARIEREMMKNLMEPDPATLAEEDILRRQMTLVRNQNKKDSETEQQELRIRQLCHF